MKYKTKAFRKQNIKVDENIDSLIFALNKKYPRLDNVTKKFFGRTEEIKLEDIEKAFLSQSDPSSLYQKYDKFITEYMEEVNVIKKDFEKNKQTGLYENKVTYIQTEEKLDSIFETYNQLKLVDVYYIKNQLLKLLLELKSEEKDTDRYRKKKIKAQSMQDKIKSLLEEKQYMNIPSLLEDVEHIENLLNPKQFNKRSPKTLYAYLIIGGLSLITLIVTGVVLILC